MLNINSNFSPNLRQQAHAMVLTLTPIINQIQLTPAAMLRTTMLARVSCCGNRWVALL
jgi:hypothetical protein